jgi:hypothetical protein
MGRRGQLPLLTRQDVADIRESYYAPGSRETATTLARLRRCSPTVIHRVLNGVYVPREDWEEKTGATVAPE